MINSKYKRGEVRTTSITEVGVTTPVTVQWCEITAEDGRKGIEVIDVAGSNVKSGAFRFIRTNEEVVAKIFEKIIPTEQPSVKVGYGKDSFPVGPDQYSKLNNDIVVFDGVEYSYDPKFSDGPLLEIIGSDQPKIFGNSGTTVYNSIIKILGLYECGMMESLVDKEGTETQEPYKFINKDVLKYKKPIISLHISGNIATINERFLMNFELGLRFPEAVQFEVRSIDMSKIVGWTSVKIFCFRDCGNVVEIKLPKKGLVVYKFSGLHSHSAAIRKAMTPYIEDALKGTIGYNDLYRYSDSNLEFQAATTSNVKLQAAGACCVIL